MSAPLRIVLAGGGTAGHVSPALAVRAATDRSSEWLYVGTASGIERDLAARANIPFAAVDAGALRGRSPVTALTGFARMLRGVAQTRGIFRRFQPDAILATGGFVCVPVVLGARLSGVPSVIYLPDLRPGWAVRFLSRIATVVAVSFDEVVEHIPARRVEVTGYPVRPEILSWTPARARSHLGFPDETPVVLVLGGSRGARTINEAIASSLEPILERAWIIHATGISHYDAYAERRRALPAGLQDRYRLSAYLDAELAPSLAAATVVVSRAGASVLGELPAVGAPSVLVPYPHAGAHQYLNARFLADRGAAVVVDDQIAQNGGLVPTVLDLLADPERRQAIAAAARALARPDAAQRLGRLVADVARAASGPRPARRPA